jgi:soluble lytic murein transglycosylase-like protein
VGEWLVRRSVQASAVALGAAIVLLPSPVGRHAAVRADLPYDASPAEHRPIDPLAAQVLERMPSLDIEAAGALAAAVRGESEAAGLDPLLVMAVIGVESAWEPGAVSERGARGLMQLRKVAQATEERVAGLAPGDVHDPAHNVRMGIRYLARMVQVFGDEDLGLMAYNTGPTRLSSYLQAVGEVPDSLWSYVRKVRREERKLRREMLRAEVLVADAAR